MIHRFDRNGYAALRLVISQRLIARLFGTSRLFRYLASEEPGRGQFEILHRFAESSEQPSSASPYLFTPKLIPKTGVYRLPAALIDTATNFIYDQDDRLIGDSLNCPVPEAICGRPAKPLKPRRLYHKEGFVYLGVPSGYYHWLIEDLPAYLQAKAAAPDATTLIPRRSPRFVTDALELLHEPFTHAPVSVRVNSLAFASKGAALRPNTVDIRSLWDFCDRLNPSSDGERKIYISRRDAGRTPTNEEEVQSLASTRGFKIVQLTGVPLAEQVSMFRSARHIVGTHGAGLANLVWSVPKSTNVLEIRLEDQPRCFELLAQTAGVEYAAVTNNGDAPWSVNLDDLATALDALE